MTRAGVAADAMVSFTDVEEHPGPYPQTMFSEGLVMESTRTEGAMGKAHTEATEMRDDADELQRMKTRDAEKNVGIGGNQY